MKVTLFLPVLFLTLASVEARQDPLICGTHAELTKKEIFLSREAAQMRSREAGARRHSTGTAQDRARTAARDIGNLAILEDSDGVVTRQNAFDLENRTVLFSPTAPNAGRYRFETRAGDYNEGLANNPGPDRQILELGDDDTREITLKFSFPFFGNFYPSVFVNSDGNLTFGAGDRSSSARSFRAFLSGPPRIAGLYTDLDPTVRRERIRVVSENWRFAVSWVAIPEFSDFDTGRPQTFQIRLYPDGRIEMAWSSIDLSEAIVGIAPGRAQGSSSIVSFATAPSAEYSSAVGEPFTAIQEVDIIAAAQKFYETHDDSYDYLVVYNTMDVRSCEGAVACEVTLRNNRTGYGDRLVDVGSELGSPRRLQAFMNMGSLSQYPTDPNQAISGRGQITGDTALTILAHEAGHLFLAFASVPGDPSRPGSTPMLSPDGSHWAFTFNSEASLLEGNRIRDDGRDASPRFTTVAVNEGYSELDQYLMGLLPPQEVDPTFYVRRTSGFNQFPQVGVTMNGERHDVTIEKLIETEGRRTPDHTVSQRRFNFAFIVIVAEGTQPTAEQLQQVDTYRREFEAYFRRATGDRASADTTLRRSLLLSASPASGVLAGTSANASVSIASPAASPVMVALRTSRGAASVSSSVTIPAGATQAVFQITGIRPGVEELTAEVGDPAYERAEARIQVSSVVSDVKLMVVSGDKQAANPGAPLGRPVVLRVTDQNNLPYPGVRVTAAVSTGGTLNPPVAVSNEAGLVEFQWIASSLALNELRAIVEGAPDSSAVIVTALGRPAFEANAVVNAASFTPGLTPGSLASVFGANLAGGNTALAGLPLPVSFMGVQLTIDGMPAPLVYISDRQINFFVPSNLPDGPADVVVSNTFGSSAIQRVNVQAITPGIFFDASGSGAILVAGTGQTTMQRPAAAGEFLEIYATGLGPVQTNGNTAATPQVSVGDLPAQVSFSGLAPGFVGLYQVNAQVPPGLAAGAHDVILDVNGKRSNSVKVRLR